MQESGGGAQQITWRTTSTDEERSEDGVWTSFSTTRRTKVELFSCVNPSYFIFKVQSTWTRDRRTSAVSSTGTNTEQQNQVEPNSTSSVKKCKNRNIFHQTLSFKRNSAELQTTKNPQILWLCFFFVWNKERVNHQRLPVEFYFSWNTPNLLQHLNHSHQGAAGRNNFTPVTRWAQRHPLSQTLPTGSHLHI